jgi:hypothetical protein
MSDKKKDDDDGWYVETEDGRKITIEETAYEMFARAHPIESFDTDKKRFCRYVRIAHPKMTNKKIEAVINCARRQPTEIKDGE